MLICRELVGQALESKVFQTISVFWQCRVSYICQNSTRDEKITRRRVQF
jgi:hypothetical protein